VDAADALADLVEISPQIRAAAVLTGEGEPIGSVGIPDGRQGILTRATRDLLAAAADFRSEERRVTQLHAVLGERDVFSVTDGQGRTIVAVASGRTAPGLVFYDLKRCLAALEGGPA
jgi:hypothetical protein